MPTSELTLLPHQSQAINKITTCDKQQLHILYHAPGTGKTILVLKALDEMLAKNTDVYICIVTPEGLDLSWKNDLLTFKKNLAHLQQKASLTSDESHNIDNDDTITGEYDSYRLHEGVNYIPYSKFYTLQFYRTLKDVHTKCILVFDEAHYIYPILRSETLLETDRITKKQQTIRKIYRTLFHECHKIILCTGTPLYNSMIDIAVLLNFCHGRRDKLDNHFISETPDGLNMKYRISGSIQSLFDFSYKHLGTIAEILGMIACLLFSIISVAKGISLVHEVWKSVSTFDILKEYFPSLFYIREVSKGVQDFSNSQYLFNMLTNMVTTKEIPQKGILSTVGDSLSRLHSFALSEKLMSYYTTFNMVLVGWNMFTSVSRFVQSNRIDMKKFVEDNGKYFHTYFPEKSTSDASRDIVIPTPNIKYVYIGNDQFHYTQYALFSQKKEFQKIDTRDFSLVDFLQSERYDEDLYLEETEPLSDQEYLYKMRLVGNTSYTWIGKRFHKKQRASDKETNSDAMWELQQHTYDVFTQDFGSITDHRDFNSTKFSTALRYVRGFYRDHIYIPIVYSNFDYWGFQAFSAYLNLNKVHHIIISPETTKDNNFLKYTQLTKHELQDKFKVIVQCVLLHPSMIEGLNFTLNPALIVLEMPEGYGKQEQLYARVLRTYSGHISTYPDQTQRPTDNDGNHKDEINKQIVQLMAGDYPVNADRLFQRKAGLTLFNSYGWSCRFFYILISGFTPDNIYSIARDGAKKDLESILRPLPAVATSTFKIPEFLEKIFLFASQSKSYENFGEFLDRFQHSIGSNCPDECIRICNIKQHFMMEDAKKELIRQPNPNCIEQQMRFTQKINYPRKAGKLRSRKSKRQF